MIDITQIRLPESPRGNKYRHVFSTTHIGSYVAPTASQPDKNARKLLFFLFIYFGCCTFNTLFVMEHVKQWKRFRYDMITPIWLNLKC